MTTFSSVLADQLRRGSGRPLLTFYDERTGERVELSVATYANWVAKAASLLVEEHDLARGDVLGIDLPAHWLGPVFLGAAWTAGLVVALPPAVGGPSALDSVDAVVCGPASLPRWAGRAEAIPVLACSLLPLGVRFAEPVPPGVHDVGVEVWSQPDSFIPWDPPRPDDLALQAGRVTQAMVWSAAAAGSQLTDGGRLLSEANPASPPGIASFTEPLVKSGSLVVVVGAGPERLDAIADAERVTGRAQPTRS